MDSALKVEDPPFEVTDIEECRACELPLEQPSEFGICALCGEMIRDEWKKIARILGAFRMQTPNQTEAVRASLQVLHASAFIGPAADKIAGFLGFSRNVTRQYAARFRASGIWTPGGDVRGPWSSKVELSPAYCRLLFMDGLVGAGLAIRSRNGWEFVV